MEQCYIHLEQLREKIDISTQHIPCLKSFPQIFKIIPQVSCSSNHTFAWIEQQMLRSCPSKSKYWKLFPIFLFTILFSNSDSIILTSTSVSLFFAQDNEITFFEKSKMIFMPMTVLTYHIIDGLLRISPTHFSKESIVSNQCKATSYPCWSSTSFSLRIRTLC